MSKPRWQRALIAFGGPAVNFIFPVILLCVFYAAVGLPHSKSLRQPLQVSYFSTAPGQASPLQVGDKIVQLNDVKSPTWEGALDYLDRQPLGTVLNLTVEGKTGRREVQASLKDPTAFNKLVGYAPFPPVIDEVAPGSPAKRAGLQGDDRVLEANGQPVTYWGQFVDAIRQSKGQTVQLKIQRKAQTVSVSVTPQQGEESVWQIGVANKVDVTYERASLGDSTEFAFRKTGDFFAQTVGVVGKLFSGRASVKQLQSVVGIAQVSGEAVRRGPSQVILLMAFISVNLGILNLLPIPILDGGQILLLSIEGLLRRDVSLAVKERIVQVGFVFLLLLFAYVMYNDVARMFTTHS